MGTVNIQVTHEGYNLSGYLISYERVNELCSGVGTLSITVDQTVPRTFNPGDTLSLSEDGNTVGTYFIKQIHINPEKGYSIEAQDASMWMEAYFLFKTYKSKGLTTKYWIGFILDKAKITYNFTTSESGYALNPTSELGMESAYDAVLRLCQQSGWYFYFDGNNVCQIGTLNSGWNNPDISIITANENVIDEYADDVDDQLRNRVVVYGGNGINVELNTRTIWDRDAKDKRTVVFSNGYINSYSTANMLGSKILNTWSQTVGQKIYTVVGHVNTSVGKTARCKTNVFKGVGRITRLSSRTDEKDGFVTQIDLDKRCPRLIGYWRTDPGEYVYVGTANNGVYRKSLDGSTWSSYNTGLTSLAIRDMKIKNGLLACTASGNKVFMRDVYESSWNMITPVGFTTSGLVDKYTSKFTTAGVAIDETTGTIIAGFNDTATSGSWIMKYYPNNTHEFIPVIAGDNNSIFIMDVDYDGKSTLAITSVSDDSLRALWDNEINIPVQYWRYDLSYGGCGNTHTTAVPFDLLIVGPTETPTDGTSRFALGSATFLVENGIAWAFSGLRIYGRSMVDGSQIHRSISWTGGSSPHLLHKDGDMFYFYDWSGALGIRTIYTYNKSTDSFGTLGTFTYTTGTTAYSNKPTTYAFMDNYVFTACFSDAQQAVILSRYDYVNDVETSTSLGYSAVFHSSSSHTRAASHSNIVVNRELGAYVAFSTICMETNGDYVDNYGYGGYLHISPQGGTSQRLDNNFYKPHTLNLGGVVGRKAMVLSQDSNGYFILSYSSGYLGGRESFAGRYFVAFGTTIIRVPDNVVLKQQEYDLDLYGGTFFSKGYDTCKRLSSNTYTVANRFDDHWPIIGHGKAYALTEVINPSTGASERWLLDVYQDVYWQANQQWSPSSFHAPRMLDEIDNSFIYTQMLDNDLWAYSFANPSIKVKEYNAYAPSDYGHCEYPTKYGVLYQETSEVNLRTYGSSTPTKEDVPLIGALGVVSDGVTTSGDNTFGVIGTFTTNVSGYMFIENSQSSPSIYFGGTILSSGISATGELQWSETNLKDSLKNVTILNNSYIPDARTAPYLELEGAGTFDKYLFVPFSGGLYYKSTTDPSGLWSNLETFSGKIHRIEVGNLDPYIFVSISGAPSVFWQLDPYETTFTNYSTGLPSSNITVIRIDDRI